MPDPLDALRAPVVPAAPDPAFAARLRRRLERALAPAGEEEPMNEVLLRDGTSRNGSGHGDVSYLTLALPDAAAGRRFYGRVLGWTFGAGRLEPEGNQVDEVLPQVGLWPGPAWRGWVTPGAIASWRVDDLDAAIGAVRAAGGTADPPQQLPYGLQSACSDGAGLRFWLHQLPTGGRRAGANGERPGDVSYLVLRVADLAAGRSFFSAVLGWTYTAGAAGVHVEGSVPMTGMSEGGPAVELCYRVADLTAAAARVAAAGGRAGEVERRPYGWEARCADDQGIGFFLHQLD